VGCATIAGYKPKHGSRQCLSIFPAGNSRQDKIHDAIEHGAEAFYLHKQFTLAVLVVALVAAIAYGSWTVYHDRQTAAATAELNSR